MKLMTIALGACVLAAPAVRGQQPSAPSPAKPIAPLAWLVGGVWMADGRTLAPTLARIETRYTWADNTAYVRFTTHFVTDQATIKNYDGSFYWDPSRTALAMWYMDAGGSITESPVAVEGNAIVMRWHGPDFDGKPADLRVTVTRTGPDAYTWLAEESQPDASWKQMATLVYRRRPEP
jgi:hypothetical protein